MKTDKGRKAAYDRVLEKFAHDYGKEFIATPRSPTPWLVPTLAVLGGVGLLVVIMRRARKAAPPPPVPPPAAGTTKSDDDYEDKLEDELSHTD